MSTVTPAVPGTSTPPADAAGADFVASLYRLTVRQFDEMIAEGLIPEDDPVELIEGLLVNKMSRSPPHIVAAKKGFRALSRVLPDGFHVAKEDPIVASNASKPEPDLAVVRGVAEDYIERDVAAADVALVVEIAVTSLSRDRTQRFRVYSASAIPFYWIVNLVDRQVEVYTDPAPAGYRLSEVLKPGQDVPVVIDGSEVGRVAVADLLP
jgi:Uma2 family endonuclease